MRRAAPWRQRLLLILAIVGCMLIHAQAPPVHAGCRQQDILEGICTPNEYIPYDPTQGSNSDGGFTTDPASQNDGGIPSSQNGPESDGGILIEPTIPNNDGGINIPGPIDTRVYDEIDSDQYKDAGTFTAFMTRQELGSCHDILTGWIDSHRHDGHPRLIDALYDLSLISQEISAREFEEKCGADLEEIRIEKEVVLAELIEEARRAQNEVDTLNTEWAELAGEQAELEMLTIPLLEKEVARLTAAIETSKSITEQKELERELQDAQSSLTAARSRFKNLGILVPQAEADYRTAVAVYNAANKDITAQRNKIAGLEEKARIKGCM